MPASLSLSLNECHMPAPFAASQSADGALVWLQVGVVALRVACRLTKEFHPPSLERLVYYCDGAVKLRELQLGEKFLLKTLQRSPTRARPTPCIERQQCTCHLPALQHLLQCFLQHPPQAHMQSVLCAQMKARSGEAHGIFILNRHLTGYLVALPDVSRPAFVRAVGCEQDSVAEHYIGYLAELSLLDYSMLRFSWPRIIAAAAYIARRWVTAWPYLSIQRALPVRGMPIQGSIASRL